MTNHPALSDDRKIQMKVSSGPVGQDATLGSRAFDVLNYIVLTLVAFRVSLAA